MTGLRDTGKSALSTRRFTLDEIRAMTDEERDAHRICRVCWESYAVCVCNGRHDRQEATS